MPAVYPDYPCQVCNSSHTLYYHGNRAVGPDLSKPYFYTCTRLPVVMRVMRGDRWKPMREQPERAIVMRLESASH